jgi:DNA-3-methyladenine glycosylase
VLWRDSLDGPAAVRIVEVEAYCGPSDLAAHSALGRRTARTEIMYAAGGVAYVYFVYGMHFCVNVVAGRIDQPEAVLLRGGEAVVGHDLMRRRRGSGITERALARGPGNLARALAIDRTLNGTDLRLGPLRILVPRGTRAGETVAPAAIARSARIGVAYAGAWAARPWRFFVRDDASVSRPPGAGGVGPTGSAPSVRSARRAGRPGRCAPR